MADGLEDKNLRERISTLETEIAVIKEQLKPISTGFYAFVGVILLAFIAVVLKLVGWGK